MLLHDGDGSGRGGDRSQTLEALPAILDEAERRGLQSVPLSALIETPQLAVSEVDPLGGRLARGRLPEGGDGQSLAREEEQAQTHSD